MLNNYFQTTYFGNTVIEYAVFLSILLGGILAIWIINAVILHRLKVWSEKTATTVDDFLIRIIDKKLIPILYFGALYLSIKVLQLSPIAVKVIEIAGVVLLTIMGIRLIVELLHYALEVYWVRKEVDITRQRNLKGIITVIKVVVWGIGITFLLDNLGFRISAVIAGLGIGGIAVALAAQTILGDLFSYFIIFFDRPFEVGDFIIVDDFMGSVEHIGIKTTRLRSLSGEQLIFSNTDLTSSRLRNYKRMENRRVLFKLGVTYQTTTKQLREIPEIISNIIINSDDTLFDRAHFSSYGDFSLNFEIVYYVKSKDYGKYMDIQQDINFAINDEFEKRGIEFAYPTQTLFIEKPENTNNQTE
jgi:small-conductance mechanosensitive channel